jgi:hypothetical protein
LTEEQVVLEDEKVAPKRIMKTPLLSRTLYILAWLSCLLLHADLIYSSAGVDYAQWWTVADVSRTANVGDVHSEPIVGERTRHHLVEQAAQQSSWRLDEVIRYRGVLAHNGTPFFYWLVRLLSTGSYELDYLLFQGSLSLLYLAALSRWLKNLSLPLLGITVGLLFFGACYGPLISDIRVGNIGRLLAAILFTVLLFQRHSLQASRRRISEFFGWFLYALSLGIKPLLVLPLFVNVLGMMRIERRHIVIANLFSVGIGITIPMFLGIHFFSHWSAWSDWWYYLQKNPMPIAQGNLSLLTIVAHQYFSISFRRISSIYTILMGIIAAITIIGIRRLPLSYRDTWRSLVPLVTLLSSTLFLGVVPLTWYHYFLILVPGLCYLVTELYKQATDPNRTNLTISAFLVVCTVLILFSFRNEVALFGYLGKELADISIASFVVIMIVATISEIKIQSSSGFWPGRRARECPKVYAAEK